MIVQEFKCDNAGWGGGAALGTPGIHCTLIKQLKVRLNMITDITESNVGISCFTSKT